ncbi:MAG: F0F1 ATP synthase subunit delta [bacterium]|nr:F0F1 ATP synthase subunit delta [bacterium]
MKRFSRKQLAVATLALLEKHPIKEVLPILAEAIIKEKRTNEVEVIIREIGSQMLQKHGQLTGILETVFPLTEKLNAEIEYLLKNLTSAKSVHLKHKINKQLVGGFKVETPTIEIDASLARPLHQLKALV